MNTSTRRDRFRVFSAIAAAAAVAAAFTAAAGPYAPSRECAGCHPIIASAWESSAHARSAASPGFLRAIAPLWAPGADPSARAACLGCHAPGLSADAVPGPGGLAGAEGVGCDFCHTLIAANEPPARAGRFPLSSDPGPVKRGPLLYTESPWHETAFSPLFASGPQLCAGCHEYRNEVGFAVLSEWSEWKEGPWPGRGVSCQGCHMPREPGTPAERAVGGASQRVVSLHRFAGADSRSRLHHALTLLISAVRRDGPRLEARITARNDGAGHSVPGGLPGRSLVLTVGIETDRERLVLSQERAWRRVVVDEQGRALVEPAGIFLHGVAEGPDTRLRAGESRDETFEFVLPQGARALVARLEYRDMSDAGHPTGLLVTEIRRNLEP